MKKILATLLVATMLMSCMTFVSFAANYTVTTIENFPYAAMAPGGAGDDLDEVGTYYYDYVLEKYGVKEKNGDDITTEELFAALWSKYYDEAEDVVLPEATKVGELVMLPILVENMGTVTVEISWDPEFLSYEGFAGEYSAAIKGLDEETGYVNFNGINMDSEDITGVWGAVFFTVNDAEGDSEGLATTDVTYSVFEAKSCGGTSATLLNDTCTYALKGLTPGVEESNDMTEEIYAEVEAAVTKTGVITADKDAVDAFVAGFANAGALTSEYDYDSYVACFANVGEYDNVAEVGFSWTNGINSGYAPVDPVEGKIGGIFYGLSTAFNESFDVRLIVTLNDGTVLGAKF